ncbi:MAG: hypothetical protein IK096_04135 [Lachnospiraceae bacterium]|nr:hypothetical protein [Lachnospiraceae bacterium]
MFGKKKETENVTEVNGAEGKGVETPATEDKGLPKSKEADGNTDVFEKLLKNSRKQVFYARLAAIFTGALFIAVAAALMIVIPEIIQTLSGVNVAIANANHALEDINTMSASITQTSESLNLLVGDNAEKLTESVDKLASMDIDGINTAVKDLQDAVGPLAETMRQMSQFRLFR